MEVVEIISHYIDKTQNLINVEFKMITRWINKLRDEWREEKN